MVVRIRLARFGKAHEPVYNIVVAQKKYGDQLSPNLPLSRRQPANLTLRSGRNKKPMEVLGTYEPIPKTPLAGEGDVNRLYKDIRLDTARTKYWLGVGAQPSDPVWKLLSMVRLVRVCLGLRLTRSRQIGLVERKFRDDDLRRQVKEADERHRAYWEAKGAGAGKTSAPAEAS